MTGKPMKHLVIFIVMMAVLASSRQPANADRSLRCGTRLVSIGDTMQKVTDACGKPSRREQWEEQIDGDIYRIFDYQTERYHLPELIHAPLRMERWTYNLGSTRFIRYLEFENGRLIRNRTGDKGHD